ncbi:serine hydrolase domain-containing protein [Winogradskyella sp.]|uniref:serine hydrolase domain-containing protein n=1 Tax=Winogradskyella sp. TaxID=1883156 RepID=UPI003BAC0D83
MTKFVKKISFICFLLSLSTYAQKLCSSDNTDNSNRHEDIEAFENTIMDARKMKFAGSVLISDENGIVLSKSYQFKKSLKDCNISPNESYWIASLSKHFCAVAILKLAEEGLLSLNDPISNFLDHVPSDKSDITLHQLLTHTSGMADNYVADGISDRDKAIQKILSDDLVQKPGATYAYSNQAYNLLAIIVELTSKTSYEAYLHNTFFKTLNLTYTGHAGDQSQWNKLKMAKKGKGASRRIKENPQLWETNYGYKGSTGILTNPTDLFIWFNALYNGKLLSKDSTTLLFTEHVKKSDKIFYGYGWNFFEDSIGKVIVHSGDDDFIGHSATLRFYPDVKRLYIVTSNTGGTYKKRPIAQTLSSQLKKL